MCFVFIYLFILFIFYFYLFIYFIFFLFIYLFFFFVLLNNKLNRFSFFNIGAEADYRIPSVEILFRRSSKYQMSGSEYQNSTFLRIFNIVKLIVRLSPNVEKRKANNLEGSPRARLQNLPLETVTPDMKEILSPIILPPFAKGIYSKRNEFAPVRSS